MWSFQCGLPGRCITVSGRNARVCSASIFKEEKSPVMKTEVTICPETVYTTPHISHRELLQVLYSSNGQYGDGRALHAIGHLVLLLLRDKRHAVLRYVSPLVLLLQFMLPSWRCLYFEFAEQQRSLNCIASPGHTRCVRLVDTVFSPWWLL
jgi:hypothetical protein